MRYKKLTIALVTAGTGVICLAPAASAATTPTHSGNITTPGAEHLGIAPCVRVFAPGGPSVTITPHLAINPCARPGVRPTIIINGGGTDSTT